MSNPLKLTSSSQADSQGFEISAKRDRPSPLMSRAQIPDNVSHSTHSAVEMLAQSAAQALAEGCQTPMVVEPIGQWVPSTEPNKVIEVWMARPQSLEGCVIPVGD